MSAGKRLRELIERQTVVLPGAFNALTALQIQRAGFEAAYVSGAGVAASRGLPDIGLVSMTEAVSDSAIIANAVTLPMLADADTGYGELLAVMRTVREFEHAGLAGIHIEDQESPKRCGHLPGKRLLSSTAMARKIGAAVEARQDADFLIVARSDARAIEGLDATVMRALAYIEAGADAVFPEALESAEEFGAFATALSPHGGNVPLVANMTEFGKTPYLTVKEFAALGYRIVLFPLTALRVTLHAVEMLLNELKCRGTQRGELSQMQTREQLYELLRYADYEQRDEDLYERYGRESEGPVTN
ncbi:MAG: methylisocitrate lyase [Nitrospiraceae bacterium]|nr:methylisocitrate lyase [Nitrospiraceae bacterium]